MCENKGFPENAKTEGVLIRLCNVYQSLMSQDYELFWKLLTSGHELVAFIHDAENEFHPYQVAKAWCYFVNGKPYEVSISSKGCSYITEWESHRFDWKKNFIDSCRKCGLIFLLPPEFLLRNMRDKSYMSMMPDSINAEVMLTPLDMIKEVQRDRGELTLEEFLELSKKAMG